MMRAEMTTKRDPCEQLREDLEEARRVNAQILDALQFAYRKHSLDDESIGWNELGGKILDALCEAMTDAGYQQWAREQVERIKAPSR